MRVSFTWTWLLDLFNLPLYVNSFQLRFSLEEVSSQNQVKASVQRRIRQSIQDEVCLLFCPVL